MKQGLNEIVKNKPSIRNKGFREIDVNIWDDYHDDSYAIPLSIKQETRIVIDEYDNKILPDTMRAILELIIIQINISFLDFGDAKIDRHTNWQTDRPMLYVEGLTHKNRERLIKFLQSKNMSYNNIPLNIYSES